MVSTDVEVSVLGIVPEFKPHHRATIGGGTVQQKSARSGGDPLALPPPLTDRAIPTQPGIALNKLQHGDTIAMAESHGQLTVKRHT